MNFDRSTGVLHSLGRETHVGEVVAWLENLLVRVSRVWFPLMICSPNVGESGEETVEES
jgi:hypothetical protein